MSELVNPERWLTSGSDWWPNARMVEKDALKLCLKVDQRLIPEGCELSNRLGTPSTSNNRDRAFNPPYLVLQLYPTSHLCFNLHSRQLFDSNQEECQNIAMHLLIKDAFESLIGECLK